jgi:ComF family protein
VFAILRSIATFALPPRCPGCGVPVEGDGRFCAPCWNSLRFIGPPWCAGCNLPFDIAVEAGATCDDCAARPPRHGGVRAAVAYGPVTRGLALKLKYGGRMGAADTMAALMARHLPADADLLVPVPLHRWRLWRRGYNQAGLIARGLARVSGTPFAADMLVRTRRTPVLKGMGGRERRRAVRGAFAVRESTASRVAGMHVALIDDIHTSGATVNACTATLLAAGAARVTVLCWARVLGDDD